MRQTNVISPDSYLISQGLYLWTPERCAQAHEKAQALLVDAMTDRRNLVVLVGPPCSGKSTWVENNLLPTTIYYDATHCTRWSRQAIIDLVRGIDDMDRHITAKVFLTPLQVCLQRNNDRSPDRRVPYDRIQKMWAQLRAEPVQENFDDITVVR